MFKSSVIGVLALLLAACGTPRPRHAVPQSPGESPSAPKVSLPGTVYRIDERHSELRILVYRAGPLARFGHNHVILNRSIRGVVNLAGVGGESTFSLSVPAAGFVVDDAQARREEGADFAAEVPDDAKSGTLHNMLSAALLDADEFPMITIRSIAAVPAHNPSGAACGCGCGRNRAHRHGRHQRRWTRVYNRGAPGLAERFQAFDRGRVPGVAANHARAHAIQSDVGRAAGSGRDDGQVRHRRRLRLTPRPRSYCDCCSPRPRAPWLGFSGLGEQQRRAFGRHQHGGGRLPQRLRDGPGRLNADFGEPRQGLCDIVDFEPKRGPPQMDGVVEPHVDRVTGA